MSIFSVGGICKSGTVTVFSIRKAIRPIGNRRYISPFVGKPAKGKKLTRDVKPFTALAEEFFSDCKRCEETTELISLD